ncbi:MAG: GIY-YIG nuclease family protein [Oceanobacter sp.]
MNNPWSLYLIRTASGALYCGVSTDVDRRFQEHCSGLSRSARYLRGKGPLQLVFIQQVGSRSLACRLESRVKRLPKNSKEKLVAGELSLVTLSSDLLLTD